MGELLQHDIISSLQNSNQSWLIQLLEAFNCGDITKFQATAPQWRSQTDLKVFLEISINTKKFYAEKNLVLNLT